MAVFTWSRLFWIRNQFTKGYLHIRHLNQSGYDVIVVGGGHAGCEAAAAAARMGAKTLMVTHKIQTIGEMSCNPSFGGIGKGHLMKEVDALDGLCGRISDKAGIHYRMLNTKKGPAVWGPRAQIDRLLYKKYIQEEILNMSNLTVIACPVEDLLLMEPDNHDHNLTRKACGGIVLENGDHIRSQTVILTTGTFLRGQINIGLEVQSAGRLGDEPAIGLAHTLENAGFKMGRLKTGTPPRLNGETIDYSKTDPIRGDKEPMPFSFLNKSVWIKPEDQKLCHLTRTSEAVNRIVKDNLHLNRHVKEETTGPRYCPSIESKVLRFGHLRHQVWLEPEGLTTDVVYPQGLSCTLPAPLQSQLVHCIPGLERAEIVQPGYGVEYDYVDPRQLRRNLETVYIQNLFFAGQINGTTGYEEAAAQGVVAGVNAVLKVRQQAPFIVDRTEGYVGVLIDDLTTHGTNEPYRMFTSRAEFRLLLRPDNADLRLTPKGYQVGCVSEKRQRRMLLVKDWLQTNMEALESFTLTTQQWRQLLESRPSSHTVQKSAFAMLGGGYINTRTLAEKFPDMFHHLTEDKELARRLEIEASYKSFLVRQQEEVDEVRHEESLELPVDIDYSRLNISQEAREKLDQSRPQTIAAASRIPGVTPAALVQLLRYVKKLG